MINGKVEIEKSGTRIRENTRSEAERKKEAKREKQDITRIIRKTLFENLPIFVLKISLYFSSLGNFPFTSILSYSRLSVLIISSIISIIQYVLQYIPQHLNPLPDVRNEKKKSFNRYPFIIQTIHMKTFTIELKSSFICISISVCMIARVQPE